jgi:hypothetical protein
LNPILLTLYGSDSQKLGWVEAVVAAALANIIGDINDVSSGKEDTKTAILNTLFPWIGKIVGNAVWPVKKSVAITAQEQPKKLSDLPVDIQQKAALLGTSIPFIGSLIYQLKKGITL